MQYNVAQLLRAPTGATRRYEVDVPAGEVQMLLDDDDVSTRGPLQGEVSMMRTTDGILVTGELSIMLALACDRCLDTIEIPVMLKLEDTFRPTIDIKSGAMLPLVSGEELATLIDEKHILDLSEVTRQNILLAVPMHPVCRQDCAGLCPQCGQNLNEGRCNCKTETVDPRWSKLERLLKEMGEVESTR
jgi:uncharacterized protein